MKFKSIKITTISDLMGIVFENSNNSYTSSYREYDENQNVILEQDFSTDGILETFNKYSYNEHNQLVETLYLDENEEVLESHKFFYENNKLIKEHVYYGANEYEEEGDFYDIIEYHYNDENQLIHKLSKDSDGEFNSEKKYFYQDKNKIREEIYGENHKLEVELIFKYDENGNIINEIRHDHIEDVKNTLEHHYNEKNLKTASLVYNNYNDLISKSLFEYNEKNQLEKTIEETRDSYVVKAYEIDENDFIITENYYNKEGDLMQYKVYTYENEILKQLDQFVFSPESPKSDEDGYLLNSSLKYDYEIY